MGAAVGDAGFVAAHTAQRVSAADPLLQAPGRPSPLLRWPLQLLLTADAGLGDFDDMVRTCFSSVTGLHLTAQQWEQAERDLAHAGLGLRSVLRDAPAAYLASVGGCVRSCRELDPNYAPAGLTSEPAVLQAVAAFNLQTQPPLPAHLAVGMKQKALVSRADAASWERHLAASPVTQPALLRSEAEQGARAWLAAVPVGRKRMEAASLVAELRRRLGVPDAVADSWCLRCDGITWTGTPYMQAPAWLAGSARSGTMLSETC